MTFPGKQAARGRHNGGMVRADRAATHRRRREQRHCDRCARPWRPSAIWRRRASCLGGLVPAVAEAERKAAALDALDAWLREDHRRRLCYDGRGELVALEPENVGLVVADHAPMFRELGEALARREEAAPHAVQ